MNIVSDRHASGSTSGYKLNTNWVKSYRNLDIVSGRHASGSTSGYKLNTKFVKHCMSL